MPAACPWHSALYLDVTLVEYNFWLEGAALEGVAARRCVHAPQGDAWMRALGWAQGTSELGEMIQSGAWIGGNAFLHYVNPVSVF